MIKILDLTKHAQREQKKCHILMGHDYKKLSLRVKKYSIDKYLSKRKKCRSYINKELRYERKVLVIVKTLQKLM